MTQSKEIERLLSETEAANYLGVSRRTLYNWRKKRTSPKYFRVGARLIKYLANDLKSWLLKKQAGIE